MALFVDGPMNSVTDLTDEDSGLLDTAQVCGINVSTKLRLAWEDVRSDLHLWLMRPRPVLEAVWQPSLRLEQIVATGTLRRWERMNALAHVYRDAYFSQLVDRYQAKWDEYTKLMRDARDVFVATGLELVTDPLRKPAPPALSTVTGAGNGGLLYASVTWVNSAGAESQSSDPASVQLAAGQYMAVSAAAAPPNAAGFNVYVGTTPDSMALQNAAPITPGGSYTYIPGAVTGGKSPAWGQHPEFRRPLVRTFLRG